MSESIWPESLDDAAVARAWFAKVVEPLADSFEASDVDRYVDLFSQVLERADPAFSADACVRRFDQIRRPKAFAGRDPENIFVLSRVTLGADIAITSVLMDAAKRRFPGSRIWFVGSQKAYDLFAHDLRIEFALAPYNRTGSIRHRIEASKALASVVDRTSSIVIDPDSRLTQLGLIQPCPDDRYFLFEGRACGWSSTPPVGSLSTLAGQWATQIFGVEGSRAYMAVRPRYEADFTVSLGIGENPAKRVADPFERKLLEELSAKGHTVLVDRGAGGEESDRVERAADGLKNVRMFEGSFADFAARIAASRFYAGYDSAGQHAAAAAGVSLLTIFAGYPNRRFVERWRPTSVGPIQVILANDL